MKKGTKELIAVLLFFVFLILVFVAFGLLNNLINETNGSADKCRESGGELNSLSEQCKYLEDGEIVYRQLQQLNGEWYFVKK